MEDNGAGHSLSFSKPILPPADPIFQIFTFLQISFHFSHRASWLILEIENWCTDNWRIQWNKSCAKMVLMYNIFQGRGENWVLVLVFEDIMNLLDPLQINFSNYFHIKLHKSRQFHGTNCDLIPADTYGQGSDSFEWRARDVCWCFIICEVKRAWRVGAFLFFIFSPLVACESFLLAWAQVWSGETSEAWGCTSRAPPAHHPRLKDFIFYLF